MVRSRVALAYSRSTCGAAVTFFSRPVNLPRRRGVLRRDARELAVDGIDLRAQLHAHRRAIGHLDIAALAGLDARLERRDIALQVLDVRIFLAVALARLGQRGALAFSWERSEVPEPALVPYFRLSIWRRSATMSGWLSS